MNATLQQCSQHNVWYTKSCWRCDNYGFPGGRTYDNDTWGPKFCDTCRTWHAKTYDCMNKTFVHTKADPYIYYPYEGIDKRKWPETFKTLLMFYHLPDWYSGGKQIHTYSFPKLVGGTYKPPEERYGETCNT
mgnify:CR=1 FL=1